MPDFAPLPYSAPIAEATRLTGISKSEIYSLVDKGVVRAKKHGRTTLIVMDTLRRHIDGLPDLKLNRRQ